MGKRSQSELDMPICRRSKSIQAILSTLLKKVCWRGGDIELTLEDYTAIEQDLRSQLEKKFDTAANGQAANKLAIKMVQKVYEPVVKAVDRRYRVIV